MGANSLDRLQIFELFGFAGILIGDKHRLGIIVGLSKLLVSFSECVKLPELDSGVLDFLWVRVKLLDNVMNLRIGYIRLLASGVRALDR